MLGSRGTTKGSQVRPTVLHSAVMAFRLFTLPAVSALAASALSRLVKKPAACKGGTQCRCPQDAIQQKSLRRSDHQHQRPVSGECLQLVDVAGLLHKGVDLRRCCVTVSCIAACETSEQLPGSPQLHWVAVAVRTGVCKQGHRGQLPKLRLTEDSCAEQAGQLTHLDGLQLASQLLEALVLDGHSNTAVSASLAHSLCWRCYAVAGEAWSSLQPEGQPSVTRYLSDARTCQAGQVLLAGCPEGASRAARPTWGLVA